MKRDLTGDDEVKNKLQYKKWYEKWHKNKY